MVNKLLIATRNSGKIREFSRMLSELSTDIVFEIVGLDDLGIDIEVEETGSTFEENAVLKARQYADASGEVALADDSGLVVDALSGAPGVYQPDMVVMGLTIRGVLICSWRICLMFLDGNALPDLLR
ncbi:MAG: hypothetical protein Ct9H300mP19_02560 [Dehalococcoidia bacterium]|nr:MAG: hypothetical protein Ct9H300mP19_02560 [Dehalococcoidia bacterium]